MVGVAGTHPTRQPGVARLSQEKTTPIITSIGSDATETSFSRRGSPFIAKKLVTFRAIVKTEARGGNIRHKERSRHRERPLGWWSSYVAKNKLS